MGEHILSRATRIHRSIAGVIAFWAVTLATVAAPITFHVAQNGNDTWSGKLPTPNADGSDGPFRTLERARDTVRQTKATASGSPITVEIHAGVYDLNAPLTFTPEDSGTADAPITYRAFGNEKPVISGGRVLTGWRQGTGPNGGDAWVLDLPEVKAGDWNFCQLFARPKGTAKLKRRYRPMRGMFAIAGLTYAPAKKTMRHRAAQDEFRFFEGDFEQWENLEDVEVLALHCWSASRLKIRELNLKKRVVAFTGYPTFRIGHWWKDQRNPYYVENIKEDLDAPGEWYLDRPTGRLTYIPMPGETLDNTDIIAPVHEQMLRVEGNPETNATVSNLRFEGLSFAVSQWNVPPKGYGGSQAMPDLRAAVEFTYATDCSMHRCTIAHTGAYGISLGLGCHNNRLDGLSLYDLGGGGIKIGNLRMKRDATEPVLPTGNIAENNLITNGGVMHFSANAVWAGIVKNCVIRHNEIRHFPYSGIAVGWSWSITPTACGGNLVQNNHIHHAVELLGDGASIYTLGNQPGTVISGNVLHDNLRGKFAPAPWQLAIYLDEGSGYIVTENNLVYRVGTHAFNINGGRHNITRNNIFGPILNADTPYIRCHLRKDHCVGNTLTGNIIYWDGNLLIDKHWPVENCHADNNIYWNCAGKDVTFKGKSFAEWQAMGQDTHSIIADPHLVNPAEDDYHLRDDSPALARGFKLFDYTQAGLQPEYKDLDNAEAISAVPPPVYDMPVPPEREVPFGFETDLEDVPIGKVPMDMSSRGATEDAYIQVSEETARSGKRCLKIKDTSGLKKPFLPYLTYTGKRETGTLTLSFAFKNTSDAPALIDLNIRDYKTAKDLGKEFIIGVGLTFTEDGTLLAGEKKLGVLPMDQWVQFDLTFGLGDDRADTYDLTVTLPNGSATAHKLPIADAQFRAMSWLGFISNGEKNAVCYLDDLSLALEP